jgi:hypothetical protein
MTPGRWRVAGVFYGAVPSPVSVSEVLQKKRRCPVVKAGRKVRYSRRLKIRPRGVSVAGSDGERPSSEIEARIEHMLSIVGENPRESLSELAKLGARLIIQCAVEDELDASLGRARYERRPNDQGEDRGEETGLRNGFRPHKLQTAEGELEIQIPQVRQAAETFASKLFPRTRSCWERSR